MDKKLLHDYALATTVHLTKLMFKTMLCALLLIGLSLLADIPRCDIVVIIREITYMLVMLTALKISPFFKFNLEFIFSCERITFSFLIILRDSSSTPILVLIIVILFR